MTEFLEWYAAELIPLGLFILVVLLVLSALPAIIAVYRHHRNKYLVIAFNAVFIMFPFDEGMIINGFGWLLCLGIALYRPAEIAVLQGPPGPPGPVGSQGEKGLDADQIPLSKGTYQRRR